MNPMMTKEWLDEMEHYYRDHPLSAVYRLVAEIRTLQAELERLRPGAEAWEIVRRRRFSSLWFTEADAINAYFLGMEIHEQEPIAAIYAAEERLKKQEAKT